MHSIISERNVDTDVSRNVHHTNDYIYNRLKQVNTERRDKSVNYVIISLFIVRAHIYCGTKLHTQKSSVRL